MRGEEVEKQKVMATPHPQFSSDLSWAGWTDKGYGQGDISPKKLSDHHLDTGCLPPLDWTGALQGWVDRHY